MKVAVEISRKVKAEFYLCLFQVMQMGFYNVSDCVHGEIVLPDYVREIIETQQFQRLKNLKQLGKLLCKF